MLPGHLVWKVFSFSFYNASVLWIHFAVLRRWDDSQFDGFTTIYVCHV